MVMVSIHPNEPFSDILFGYLDSNHPKSEPRKIVALHIVQKSGFRKIAAIRFIQLSEDFRSNVYWSLPGIWLCFCCTTIKSQFTMFWIRNCIFLLISNLCTKTLCVLSCTFAFIRFNNLGISRQQLAEKHFDYFRLRTRLRSLRLAGARTRIYL